MCVCVCVCHAQPTVLYHVSFDCLNDNLFLLIQHDEDKEGEWRGEFSFIQAADTQFGLIDKVVRSGNDTNT